MTLSLLAYGLSGAGGLWLNASILLLTSRIIVGFCSACMITTCVSGIAEQFDGHRRARVIGASAASASFGALVATLIGGTLAHNAGWRMAFLQYPVFAAIGLGIAYAGMPPAIRANPVEECATGRPFLRMLPLFLLTSVLSVMMFMGATQFAFLLHADGVRDPSFKSLIMVVINVVAAFTSAAYGFLERRVGAQIVFFLALASMAVGLSLLGGTSSPLLAASGAALMGLYVGIVIPYLHHVVTIETTPTTRPKAIGFLNSFNFLGVFLNPLIFAPIGRGFGLRGEFFAGSVLAAFLALGALIVAILQSRRSGAQLTAADS